MRRPHCPRSNAAGICLAAPRDCGFIAAMILIPKMGG